VPLPTAPFAQRLRDTGGAPMRRVARASHPHEAVARTLSRAGSRWAAVAGGAAALACAPRRGLDGALAALAGAFLVAVLFRAGVFAVSRLLRYSEIVSLPGALVAFLTLTGAMLAVLQLLVPWALDRAGFAIGALGATIAWQAGAARSWRRARQLIYTEPAPESEADRR